jgi:hydrogenase maturation protease
VKPPRSVLVVGIGNELRADDGAGLEVVRALAADELPAGVRLRELRGEALDLIELWTGADSAIVIDSVCSGVRPGVLHRLDASSHPLPAQLAQTSSHAVSLSGTIELARSLNRLPPVVVVFGIEGSQFGLGAPLSEGVRQAIPVATRAVVREAMAQVAG